MRIVTGLSMFLATVALPVAFAQHVNLPSSLSMKMEKPGGAADTRFTSARSAISS